jgi:hypothetical protein
MAPAHSISAVSAPTRPALEENPYGAWYVKTEVPGAAADKLAGKTIALKDNIVSRACR